MQRGTGDVHIVVSAAFHTRRQEHAHLAISFIGEDIVDAHRVGEEHLVEFRQRQHHVLVCHQVSVTKSDDEILCLDWCFRAVVSLKHQEFAVGMCH